MEVGYAIRSICCKTFFQNFVQKVKKYQQERTYKIYTKFKIKANRFKWEKAMNIQQ